MPTNNHNTLRKPDVYAPRTSEGVSRAFEILSQEPEFPLSDQEREAFFEIEKQLLDGSYDKQAKEPIGEWYKSKSEPINFVLEYFSTDEGASDLVNLIGENNLGINPPTRLEIDISRTLAEISLSLKDNPKLKQDFKRLAVKSHQYIAGLIYEDNEHTELTTEPNHFTIHTNPESILGDIQDIKVVRENLRYAYKHVLSRNDLTDKTKKALQLIISVYMQKTAERLGQLYPDYVDIYQVAISLSRGEDRDRLLEELKSSQQSMFIVAEKVDEAENGNTESASTLPERFAWTMDRWRNGTVLGFDNTAISLDLEAYASEIEDSDIQIYEGGDTVFNPEEAAIIDSLIFEAKDIADMARYILGKNNILSSSDAYVVGQWPEDSIKTSPKIGVSVGPYPNLSYKRGWILIPENLKRKAFQQSPSGALQVLAHEIEHAIDGITSYKSDGLELAEVTTRGSTAIREGIGKSVELQVSEKLVGRFFNPSLTYYKALEEWLSTGSEVNAIREFALQAARESDKDKPTKAQVSNAENRVQRLIGKHGLNSQALVYIEQALIAECLKSYDDKLRDCVAANSGFDLHTQALLHQYGLLEQARYMPEAPIIDCLVEYIRIKYL
jgi:hypothetical protein